MTDYTIRTTCRLCEGPLELVLDLGETPLANELMETAEEATAQDRFPLRLCRCGDERCLHWQLDCVVNPKRMFAHYPYQSGLAAAYRRHLESYAEDVEGGGGWEPELAVEIGGNDGTFLSALRKRFPSVRTVNIDPCDVSDDMPSDSLAPHTRIREFFTRKLAGRVAREIGRADLVVANHVFAHSDQLADIADGIRELLADDGTAWIEVGHGPTQLNSGCLDVIYHEHVSYHNLASLSPFLERHGLFVHRAYRNKAQGGSLRLRCKKTRPDSDERIGGDQFDISGIKAAAEHLKGLGELLYKIDRNIRYPVGLYGCPAKATTLMRLMEFVPKLAFDDSPQKVGRFLPGTQTVIRSPTELEWCDSALIASWNFADQIIAAHPEYTGTWIVPLPQIRFVKGGGR